MWQLDQTPFDLPDTGRFLAALNAQAGFLDPRQPAVVARAPGRLDLMGGIADYSGSLVLELPLAAAAWVAVQPDDNPTLTVRSLTGSEPGGDPEAGAPEVGVPVAALTEGGAPLDYAAAQARLSADPRQAWAAYLIGPLVVLGRERGWWPGQGAAPAGVRLLLYSEVPPGKGVSSSAALEVAAMLALAGLAGLTLSGRDLALLCQQAENLVVGAPCGVMDQMTSANGLADHLVALLCQPAELQAPLRLAPGLEVWGVDSGIRHAVSGADYGSVRAGAFMGYRILAELAGLPVRVLGEGRVAVDDARWHGYLANVTPSEWETHFRDRVPEQIAGADFLARYGGFTDTVTRIDPARTYAVRAPTAHPIDEHHRVRLFRALLLAGAAGAEAAELLGELMYQSHASYSACGLGSAGTDRLVELVRAAGPAHGLYGAKITGGGSGGTVAVLARSGLEAQVRALADAYARETGRPVAVLGGSSPGAVAFGAQRLRWSQA